MACVSLAGYDLSLNVVAALLTIIGYSVNDTIVIFDRVRENAKQMPKEGLDAVVNLSVNQTLSRTVITAGMTFLSVVALYVFGGEALQGFAFTMIVGIIAGTYSTVFIASAIATLLSERGQSRSRQIASFRRTSSTISGKLTRVDEVAAVRELEVTASQLRRHEPRLFNRNVRIVRGVVDRDPLLVVADLLPLPLRPRSSRWPPRSCRRDRCGTRRPGSSRAGDASPRIASPQRRRTSDRSGSCSRRHRAFRRCGSQNCARALMLSGNVWLMTSRPSALNSCSTQGNQMSPAVQPPLP
jgi:hypothetical protein